MKKWLLCFWLLSVPALASDPFSVYTAQAPEGCVDLEVKSGALTLPDLIQIGICNNPALNRDYMVVKAAEAELGQSKAAYLPEISATASASQTLEKVQKRDTDKAYPYAGNVALSWLVYDFGGRSAKTEQMKAYLDAAAFTHNAVLHDTVLAVNQAYFDLLSAQEVLKSAQESEKLFKKSYQESARRFELGLVSSSDKLLAKTTYEQSRLDVVQAENTLKKAQGALAVLLNLSPDTVVKVTQPKKDKDITKLETDETVQEMMETALNLRPELKSQTSKMTAAEREIAVIEAADWPSISAGAKAGWGDSWKKDNPYAVNTSVGISMSLPIFTGFADTYKLARAKYLYRQAALAVAETQDSVRSDVWNSYQDYVTAVEAYRISKTVRDSATENERVAFASYQVGKGSILELLTAGSQLASAKQQVIVAFYSVLTNKANLYRAIGRF